MDTAVLTALYEITAPAGEADLSACRNPHHMVGAHPLIIMGCIYKADGYGRDKTKRRHGRKGSHDRSTTDIPAELCQN